MTDEPGADGSPPPLSRRRALSLGVAGVAGLTTLAGCLGGTTGGDAPRTTTSPTTDAGGESGADPAASDTATATVTAGSDDAGGDAEPLLGGHPVATDLRNQPRLGPDPAAATGVIVAFEDPSCTNCRRFEQNTVPKIRSELVETGKAALVVRTYPVIYPWGKPAVQALESTFARDEAAFWGLFEHYFAEQPSFDTGNVLEKTETWLAANTDLDAAAVVSDAREKVHDAAVQSDLSAGREGGAGGTTPAVFLFRDGEYRTKAQGSVSFDLVRSALDL